MNRRWIASALTAWVLMVGLASAEPITEPTYNATINPAPARIQNNSDKICRWLRKSGHPLPVCPRNWVIHPDEAKAKYKINYAPNAVALRAGVVWDSALLMYRDDLQPSSPEPFGDEAYISTHELIHWFNVNELPGGTWEYTNDMLWWEEAIADAYANDILPAMWSQVYGVVWQGNDYVIYPKRTASIRAASARATRGSWKARPARLWRRKFAKAGWPERQAMLAAIGVNLTLTPSSRV